MTPEEAQALEPGTTPGPWDVYSSEALGGRITTEIGPIAPRCHCDGLECGEADVNLAAAAPDMRATIAALGWEWAVQVETEPGQWIATGDPWQPSREGAKAQLSDPYVVPDGWNARLVRRLVGPVEVVEG